MNAVPAQSPGTGLLSTLRRWLPLLLLIALLVMEWLGYLTPIADWLRSDALTLTLGDKHISAYMVVKAVIAVSVLFWIASIGVRFGDSRIRKMVGMRPSNRELISKFFQICVYALAFLLSLELLNIDITAFAVVGGALGIGLGFGLQKITSNFISGLILLVEKSVEEDDLIELQDGTVGFVRKVGARYTLIETFESRDMMIPNEDFITNQVTNWTFSNTLGRIDIEVGVAYGSDLELVAKLLVEAAQENPRCAANPPAESFLLNYGDSSVNFLLNFWVEDIVSGRRRPRSDVLFSIWRKFEENDIVIPFPQRDVHIKEP